MADFLGPSKQSYEQTPVNKKKKTRPPIAEDIAAVWVQLQNQVRWKTGYPPSSGHGIPPSSRHDMPCHGEATGLSSEGFVLYGSWGYGNWDVVVVAVNLLLIGMGMALLHPLLLALLIAFVLNSLVVVTVLGVQTTDLSEEGLSAKSFPKRGLDQDVQALLALRREMAMDSSVLDDWGSSQNPCGWSGVECDEIITIDGAMMENRVVGLQLNSKQLSGSLSPAIGGLSELKRISFADNMLAGRIPKDIASCLKLEFVDLRGNRLSGPVPSEVNSLTNIKVLHFSDNHLSGELSFLEFNSNPDRLSVPFPHLKYLDLANNKFSGKIPSQIGRISELESIFLNGNMLVGTIPYSLGYLPTLMVLHIHNNFLHGNLPAALANNCSKLQSLDVSNNFLVGRIPSSLSEAKALRFLNASNNNLEGPIPWGAWFKYGADPTAFSGNHRLCGYPLKSCSENSIHQKHQESPSLLSQLFHVLWPKSPPTVAIKTRFLFLETKAIAKLGRPAAPAPAPAPANRHEQGSNNTMAPAPPPKKGKHKKKKHSTRRWAWGLCMGIVSGAISAVLSSFLFRLFLYCIRGKPKVQGALIYSSLIKKAVDYGSLQQVLSMVAEGTMELGWPIRHKIAVGIASGLQYLHFHSHPKIIHRDLKPGNILLDDNFEAHVADFGLAKAVPEAATHITSSNVAGTVGYIAPEYHQTLKFTDKCDVYSFGVVLAVLVTGKQPYDDFFQTIPEASIPKWLRNVLGSGNTAEAIDPTLRGQGFDDEIFLMLKIACFCTDDNPSKRPNSREVLSMLSQIRS
eukprot:Gb_10169 [translate_table: standard]